MIDTLRKLDKHIVHKSHDDDVLIYDPRHLLAAWLPLDVLQQAESDPEVLNALHEAYRVDGERLILRSLPGVIHRTQLDQNGLDSLGEYYEPSEEGRVLSSQWLPEHLEALLSAQCSNTRSPLDIPARQRLHECFKRLPGYPANSPVCYTMYNDTSNYFFYRKHHEHVPGLMLIEVARQAMYAEFYAHSDFKRGEVSISILDLDSRSPRYTESSYPVSVMVSDYDAPMEKKPRKMDKRGEFFQNGHKVAEIHLLGEVIKMPVFKRMRNISIDPTHWFRPLKGIRREAMIRLTCGRHLTGEIALLSMNGLQVRYTPQTGDAWQEDAGHVYLYLENDGLITLPVASIQDREDAHGSTLHLQLASLDSRQRFNWREVLKQFSYFAHSDAPPAETWVEAQA
ncbi:AfsA-related hotdog domain-containing protein [Pseudomonas sp. NPDC088444]|uniref:AfsA-related hotdog domain-containing protein n=1 Tax=Pseudomonas sp. NPDC088444 TaxID=3364456 RepID=UPI00384EECED